MTQSNPEQTRNNTGTRQHTVGQPQAGACCGNSLPLSGVTVLEFSHTIMGPCAGLVMADLGADVIKIEPAPDGDKTRGLNGFAAGFFATFNRNKRSLCVNLKTSKGQALVHQLARQADVVVENYGPGTMERLGCGWQQLVAENPRLVYLALKGFLAGPWEQRPALDEVVQFQSGLAYMTGPEGRPMRAGASIVDILGAVFGVTGVLAALRETERTGTGQRVGSALFESAAFMMASHMAGGAAAGQPVPPMSARKGAWGIYDVFKASDGTQLFIGVTSDAQWQRFCETFELPELFADKRLATNPQRTASRSWLLPAVEARVKELPYKQVLSLCEKADISWSPVAQPESLFDNEQLASDGMLDTSLETALESVLASVPLPGLPLEFGEQRQRTKLYRQPPATGEHNTEILQTLGVTTEQLDQLRTDAIIS